MKKIKRYIYLLFVFISLTLLFSLFEYFNHNLNISIINTSSGLSEVEELDLMIFIDDIKLIDTVINRNKTVFDWHDFSFIKSVGKHKLTLRSRKHKLFYEETFTLENKKYIYITFIHRYSNNIENIGKDLLLNDKQIENIKERIKQNPKDTIKRFKIQFFNEPIRRYYYPNM